MHKTLWLENFPEFYEFLDYYFFNLRCICLEFFRTVSSETILKKKATVQFS